MKAFKFIAFAFSYKSIFSLITLSLSYSSVFALNNNIYEQNKIPIYKPKLGIASTQTEFGARAVPAQAKRIEIIKIGEECEFDPAFIKVEYKEPVRFVIKNINPYPVHLIFTSLEKPIELIKYYKTIPVAINKTKHHTIKIEGGEKYTLNWFFNRKKYFKWICSNMNQQEANMAEIQVGNASKLTKKQRIEQKKQNKSKALPPPPAGF